MKQLGNVYGQVLLNFLYLSVVDFHTERINTSFTKPFGTHTFYQGGLYRPPPGKGKVKVQVVCLIIDPNHGRDFAKLVSKPTPMRQKQTYKPENDHKTVGSTLTAKVKSQIVRSGNVLIGCS